MLPAFQPKIRLHIEVEKLTKEFIMKVLTVNRKIVLSIVAAMLLIYGIQGTGNLQAQENAPELTPVSDRTPQVRDTIVALVPGVDSANDVTACTSGFNY